MPRSPDDLGAGEWAVLAILAEQPTHGFAVARAMSPDGEIGKVWTMRRPLVYRAIDLLTEAGFARPTATVASSSGPRRTLVEATPAGRRALAGWLAEPVEHVRDARSLLMLKLLFHARGGSDSKPLLTAQRERFDGLARRLAAATDEADGFDQVLLRWRLESTTAAVRFIDGLDG
ncbi:MAG TPA: helix-turn-helix transcriptional regulator [Solirubrobacteraceae bacterium]|jgi:DNA-binding PadR family transcriptional regulator